jgi:hypothetical protein
MAIAVVYLGYGLERGRVAASDLDAKPYTTTHCAGVRSIVNGRRRRRQHAVSARVAIQADPQSRRRGAARGQVEWAAPVARLDPRFPLGNPGVTLKSLLAHRSGLPEHAGDLLSGHPLRYRVHSSKVSLVVRISH